MKTLGKRWIGPQDGSSNARLTAKNPRYCKQVPTKHETPNHRTAHYQEGKT